MSKSSIWNRGSTNNDIFTSFPLLVAILVVVVAPLFGGVLGMLSPTIVVVIVGALFMTVLIAFRQDELVATVAIAIHLCVDWYLAQAGVALVMVLVLLVIFFLARSDLHPWVEPRAFWLWALFLILAIFPAIQGALTRHDALIYYPNIVFGALIMYWLGAVIGRNTESVRRLFQFLTLFAVLIAIHTILQTVSDRFLFGTPSNDSYIASTSNRTLDVGYAVPRSGSYFIDPNWNAAFLATVFFLPLGLFVETPSFLKKALYLAAMLIILPALLFTYSNGAWIAAGCGIVAFIIFVGRTLYRIQLSVFIVIAVAVLFVVFPAQIALQLQHGAQSNDRIGAWLTALHVIYTFPLTGVGLGHQAYLLRAEPYRSLMQELPLDHPHNSYLEWGAMAGLPVVLIFVALLGHAFWLAVRNWKHADVKARCLLGAGLSAIVTLSINSWGIDGWTFPALAATGWIILGCISSPLLAKSQNRTMMQKGSSCINHNS
jgi:O-antigen ligase